MKWIKCPYPGEKPGQGKWYPCDTPWLKYFYTWTKLPKHEGDNPPE
jgi:hypothetical protein